MAFLKKVAEANNSRNNRKWKPALLAPKPRANNKKEKEPVTHRKGYINVEQKNREGGACVTTVGPDIPRVTFSSA